MRAKAIPTNPTVCAPTSPRANHGHGAGVHSGIPSFQANIRSLLPMEPLQHHSNQQHLHSYTEAPSQNLIKLLKTAPNLTRNEQLELALGSSVVLACRYNNSLALKYVKK